ncbi:hypothetical protein THASP1DRAFT_23786 [Thamnocephalis sphaerospora]|uniref:BZIP domain-containing protein n=1 Tax=Thamnocephalis sphaerospora TaxID=78915 RepID=A0A4P9XRN1_9FUNG|nr:hypothetical protein THASP1DRAFT_23786 [Thamnocephalis sphaerospora]|eukprot:RKP08171.1 hypothetical protein THASP1DRAFT_23786 [Thamnocephalis sphaerospora]
MSEDPFDAFVDLQMADESTNAAAAAAATVASSSNGIAAPCRVDALAGAGAGYDLSWGSTDTLSPAVSASELFQYYLSDQLAFMSNDPAALAAAAAAAEVAAVAATSRSSASPVHSPLRATFDPQTTPMATSVSAPSAGSTSPVAVKSAPLGFVPSLAALNANTADAWMTHLLSSGTTPPAGPAVQPSQLLLHPESSGMDVDLADGLVALPGARRDGRRQSVSSKVSAARTAAPSGAPYATGAAVSTGTSKRAARAAPIKTSFGASRSTAGDGAPSSAGTTAGSASADGWPESPRSRRSSKLFSRHHATSSDDDDMEDEDMVNELISLRAGVAASKGLGQARRDPLPDEDEIRKMTPKERRQLRNKISARNFRLRRKEYIGTLEAEVKETRGELSGCRTRLNDVEQENRALRKEVCSLREQLEAAMAAAAALNLKDVVPGTPASFPLSPVAATSASASSTGAGEAVAPSVGSASSGSGSSSAYNLLARKRPALRNPVTSSTAMTRSASNSSTASNQLLTPAADDIHKDRSASHPTWGEHRIIVH